MPFQVIGKKWNPKNRLYLLSIVKSNNKKVFEMNVWKLNNNLLRYDYLVLTQDNCVN